jgi:hypothetical protein
MQMIKYKSQLLAYLKQIGYSKSDYRIAVEALIFTPERKLIQGKRGQKVMDEVGKLEGIGGSVGDINDLHQALQERVHSELGPNVKVQIDRLLEVRQVVFDDRDRGPLDWVVVSYLCKLIGGRPVIGEPDATESLQELTLDELYAMDEAKLSRSTVLARITYRAKYGNRPYFETASER